MIYLHLFGCILAIDILQYREYDNLLALIELQGNINAFQDDDPYFIPINSFYIPETYKIANKRAEKFKNVWLYNPSDDLRRPGYRYLNLYKRIFDSLDHDHNLKMKHSTLFIMFPIEIKIQKCLRSNFKKNPYTLFKKNEKVGFRCEILKETMEIQKLLHDFKPGTNSLLQLLQRFHPTFATFIENSLRKNFNSNGNVSVFLHPYIIKHRYEEPLFPDYQLIDCSKKISYKNETRKDLQEPSYGNSTRKDNSRKKFELQSNRKGKEIVSSKQECKKGTLNRKNSNLNLPSQRILTSANATHRQIKESEIVLPNKVRSPSDISQYEEISDKIYVHSHDRSVGSNPSEFVNSLTRLKNTTKIYLDNISYDTNRNIDSQEEASFQLISHIKASSFNILSKLCKLAEEFNGGVQNGSITTINPLIKRLNEVSHFARLLMLKIREKLSFRDRKQLPKDGGISQDLYNLFVTKNRDVEEEIASMWEYVKLLYPMIKQESVNHIQEKEIDTNTDFETVESQLENEIDVETTDIQQSIQSITREIEKDLSKSKTYDKNEILSRFLSLRDIIHRRLHDFENLMSNKYDFHLKNNIDKITGYIDIYNENKEHIYERIEDSEKYILLFTSMIGVFSDYRIESIRRTKVPDQETSRVRYIEVFETKIGDIKEILLNMGDLLSEMIQKGGIKDMETLFSHISTISSVMKENKRILKAFHTNLMREFDRHNSEESKILSIFTKGINEMSEAFKSMRNRLNLTAHIFEIERLEDYSKPELVVVKDQNEMKTYLMNEIEVIANETKHDLYAFGDVIKHDNPIINCEESSYIRTIIKERTKKVRKKFDTLKSTFYTWFQQLIEKSPKFSMFLSTNLKIAEKNITKVIEEIMKSKDYIGSCLHLQSGESTRKSQFERIFLSDLKRKIITEIDAEAEVIMRRILLKTQYLSKECYCRHFVSLDKSILAFLYDVELAKHQMHEIGDRLLNKYEPILGHNSHNIIAFIKRNIGHIFFKIDKLYITSENSEVPKSITQPSNEISKRGGNIQHDLKKIKREIIRDIQRETNKIAPKNTPNKLISFKNTISVNGNCNHNQESSLNEIYYLKLKIPTLKANIISKHKTIIDQFPVISIFIDINIRHYIHMISDKSVYDGEYLTEHETCSSFNIKKDTGHPKSLSQLPIQLKKQIIIEISLFMKGISESVDSLVQSYKKTAQNKKNGSRSELSSDFTEKYEFFQSRMNTFNTNLKIKYQSYITNHPHFMIFLETNWNLEKEKIDKRLLDTQNLFNISESDPINKDERICRPYELHNYHVTPEIKKSIVDEIENRTHEYFRLMISFEQKINESYDTFDNDSRNSVLKRIKYLIEQVRMTLSELTVDLKRKYKFHIVKNAVLLPFLRYNIQHETDRFRKIILNIVESTNQQTLIELFDDDSPKLNCRSHSISNINDAKKLVVMYFDNKVDQIKYKIRSHEKILKQAIKDKKIEIAYKLQVLLLNKIKISIQELETLKNNKITKYKNMIDNNPMFMVFILRNINIKTKEIQYILKKISRDLQRPVFIEEFEKPYLFLDRQIDIEERHRNIKKQISNMIEIETSIIKNKFMISGFNLLKRYHDEQIIDLSTLVSRVKKEKQKAKKSLNRTIDFILTEYRHFFDQNPFQLAFFYKILRTKEKEIDEQIHFFSLCSKHIDLISKTVEEHLAGAIKDDPTKKNVLRKINEKINNTKRLIIAMSKHLKKEIQIGKVHDESTFETRLGLIFNKLKKNIKIIKKTVLSRYINNFSKNMEFLSAIYEHLSTKLNELQRDLNSELKTIALES